MTLQIILRNEIPGKNGKKQIPGNSNLFKVTNAQNKLWLMFVSKGTAN